MYFTETGASLNEAMEKVRLKWGKDAKVVNYDRIRKPGFLGIGGREEVEVHGYVPEKHSLKPKNTNLEETKKEFAELNKQRSQAEKNEIIEELKGFREELRQELKNMPRGSAEPEEPENLKKVRELLAQNDFSQAYTQEMVQRFRRELSLEELGDWDRVENQLADWIASSFALYQEDRSGRSLRVIILIGPTGVGKTTTLAKIAAESVLKAPKNRVPRIKLVTIDNFRIEAQTQLAKYAEILECPVAYAQTFEELETIIHKDQESEIIYIDTTGRSPRDYMSLAEMQKLLSACGRNAEYYLTFDATKKTRDMEEILKQFDFFRYRAVIITKLDETNTVGNLISLLWQHKKPLLYIANGQAVPKDLVRATAYELMQRLEGFSLQFERFQSENQREEESLSPGERNVRSG